MSIEHENIIIDTTRHLVDNLLSASTKPIPNLVLTHLSSETGAAWFTKCPIESNTDTCFDFFRCLAGVFLSEVIESAQLIVLAPETPC